ncbi:hypothetical protein BDB01DRAFT_764543 [Pilobolus umbonatus]|nr:hypothetical protein BDB01DRAFT_764543 [Pilobolus umbonatus]
MAVDVSYRKLQQDSNELNGSLLIKYRMAQALTAVSLLAIIGMAIYSILYPRFNYSISDPIVESMPLKCYLPNRLLIPESEDGTYTPPSPHQSLLRAVSYASTEEYQDYCKHYTPEGFTDEWEFNEDQSCGDWEETYMKRHAHDLSVLEGYKKGKFPSSVKNKPRFISYICQEVPANSNRGCGGLADRMGGMISTFFYALLTNRTYLLNWSSMNPLPLEAIWERPHIDWSHDPEEMEQLFTDDSNPFLGYQKVDTLNRNYTSMGEVLFPNGPETDFDDLWNGTYVEVRSNRGYIIRTFQTSTRYTELLNSMGLTMENTFKCITNFLFRPTIGSRRFLNAYRYLFQMESVLSIGIQIRTDDNALANPQNDIQSMEKWGYFLKCAGELARVKKEPHHNRLVFFLVTDSAHLRDEFVSLNKDREKASLYLDDLVDMSTMIVTGLPIEHIEPDQIAKYIKVDDPKAVNLARMRPGVNSAYMENWLLGLTQYRIISQQGYGKMAAFYSGVDNSSVSLRKPGKAYPVCSNPDAMVSFKWLSTQWSLG